MDLMELLKTRRTYRRFDQTRPVGDDIQREMKEAVRYASSAMNKQVLRFMFIGDSDRVETIFPYTHWGAALPKGAGQPKEGEHPTLFVLVLCPEGAVSNMVDIDAGLAYANMTLAAWNHQVGSCILHNIEKEKIAAVINIPEGYRIHSLVGFGYPTHTSRIVDVEDGNTAYYLDENRDYCVPKRSSEDLFFE